jgi:acid phosphatase type 7
MIKIPKKLRTLIFILAIWVVWGCPSHAADQFRDFAIISDTHVGLSATIYPDFIKAIEAKGISTIIHLGDAVNSGSEAQWKTFRETTGKGKTLYLVMGNHDVDNGRNEERTKEFFPKLYYSIAEQDSLFVFLNTEIPGQRGSITGAQFDWLANELQRPFKYKFVFLHRPPYPVVPGHGLDSNRAARDKLHELFVRHKVSAVFAGHDHVYNRTTRDGIIYIIASGGGGPLYFSAESGGYFHYVLCERAENIYSFIVFDSKGEPKDHFIITK